MPSKQASSSFVSSKWNSFVCPENALQQELKYSKWGQIGRSTVGGSNPNEHMDAHAFCNGLIQKTNDLGEAEIFLK